MNEKQLGDALLHFDATTDDGRSLASPDPRVLTANVLDRDRRRVRRLAAITALFWLLATAAVPVFFWLLWVFVHPKLERVAANIATQKDIPPPVLGNVVYQMGHVILLLGTILFTTTVVASLLAGLSTLMLVFAARRATLRQINANLAQVAQDVRLLQGMMSKNQA